jgi:L-methionine (R)-S-oxide reductase
VRSTISSQADSNGAIERCVRVLHAEMPHYTWVGIYLLDGNELVLGPYVGKPSPHTRIPLGRGICGAAAAEKTTIVVDDVNADPRYLACSLETKSEIVVPIMDGIEVLGEIDIDSDQAAAFGADDRELLEAVAVLLAPALKVTLRQA